MKEIFFYYNFINFPHIAHESSPDDLESDFEDNFYIYVLCPLLSRNEILETLNTKSRERKCIIKSIFQNFLCFSILIIF